MLTDIQIRVAATKDFNKIAIIYNEYIELGYSTMDEEPLTEVDIDGWVSNFNSKEQLYVLQKVDEIIGWGIIKKYSDRNGYRFTGETAIYITAKEKGKGYGSHFKKFLIDKCRELGYHHLVAKVLAINETSIAYNLKLGYSIVGTQKEIGFREGQWMDVVILQMIL